MKEFVDADDIVTKLPYEVRVLPMNFHLGQSDEEKGALIKERLFPGEVYRLDAIIEDAQIPTNPYARPEELYDPNYIQNVIIVKKK